MKTITIIGGGLSGTLLAINLLKQNPLNQKLQINIIEKNKGKNFLGAAYSTNKPYHLLNVRSRDMGALANDKLHFYKWIKQNNHPVKPSGFAARMLYRKYIQELFKTTIAENKSTAKLIKINDEATDITLAENGKSALVQLKNGQTLQSDKVILAIGNLPPKNLPLSDDHYLKSAKYFSKPWENDFTVALKPDDTVFIIGTSLTMVDTVLSLYHRKHKGKIIALSRHGDLPFAHKIHSTYPAYYNEIKNTYSVLETYKIIKKHIKIAASKGKNWYGVIDALRPYSQKIWQAFPAEEKKIFLKRFNHFWDISRHRIPKECANILSGLQQSGKLKIEAGQITSITNADDIFTVEFQAHKTHKTEKIKADFIINCTGPQTNYNTVKVPLISNIIQKGLLCSDALSIGINATAKGALIDKNGKVSSTLFTLGTPLKGILWECTAVPEIRQQAYNLAKLLLSGK